MIVRSLCISAQCSSFLSQSHTSMVHLVSKSQDGKNNTAQINWMSNGYVHLSVQSFLHKILLCRIFVLLTVNSVMYVSFFQHSDSHGKPEAVLEAGELEGDTLDPQTGLFYRSTQPASEPTKQPAHSASAQPPPLSQAEAEQSRHPSTSTSTQQTPPQLQSKPQISQPSSSSTTFPSTPLLTKKIPKLREQSQPKPQTLTQSPKDRPVSAPTPAGAKATTPSTPTKPMLTPQLPKLQQAPTSHHRPLHTSMSHPPPLQAHHPVSTDKTASSQVSGFYTCSPGVNFQRQLMPTASLFYFVIMTSC